MPLLLLPTPGLWTQQQNEMGFLAVTLGCLTAPVVASFSIPSPGLIGSDISLLYYNDLDRKLYNNPYSTSRSHSF